MRTFWMWIAVMSCGAALAYRAAGADDSKPAPVELQIYDVADLVKQPTDYPAPITLPGVSSSGVAEPWSAAVTTAFKAADLVTLLHDRVFPWEFANQQTSIAEHNGCLVVMQTPEMQKRVHAYILKLHETLKPQVVVKGIFFAAAEIPANILDAAAFGRLTAAIPPESILGSPRLVCYNGQRVHARSGRNFNFIRDYDVAGSVYHPVTDTGFDGIVLEARPSLASDRLSANVDVRFTFTALNGKIDTHRVILASPSATTLTLPLDTPAVDTQNLCTTLRVPLGKWVLAGAMNNPNPESKDKRLLLYVTVERSEKGKAPAAK